MLKRTAIKEVYIEIKMVFETAISTWTRLSRIKMRRWIVTSCKEALYPSPISDQY